MSGFFRGHKRRGSYDLFSSYNHFLPGWGGMFVLIALFLLGSIIGAGVMEGMTMMLGEPFVLQYGMIVVYPLTFIPAMIYASTISRINEHRVDAIPMDRKLYGIKNILLLATTCSLATIATAFLIEPLPILLRDVTKMFEQYNEFQRTMDILLNAMPFWATILSVSVFAPLFEEWLCRGAILRGLLQKKSPAAAICISAFVFAAIHLNFWQAIPAFIIGLLLGYVYYKTGSLKLTILMHCVNNTLSACLSRVPEFKNAETFMDILSPWAYWCIFAACILILASALVILRNVQQHQDCPACRHQ